MNDWECLSATLYLTGSLCFMVGTIVHIYGRLCP